MLRVENLTVAYGPHRALEDVSIHVERSEICVILGANGAGKSTLLKAIAGMVGTSPGARITNGDADIGGLKPHAIVEAGVALVPEGRGIFGDLTVAENLRLGAYGRQARASEKTRLAQVLGLFPRLGERRGQTARTMSGGEQQMVAIGRALMSNPAILMLDEPSLGLSPLLTRDLFKSLRAVRETGVGILLVEQNARLSLAIADRGYLLENGHIVGEDTAAKLANDPAVQAAYLGGAAGHKTSGPARKIAAMPASARKIAATNAARTPDPAEEVASRAARIHRAHVESRRPNAARSKGNDAANRYGSGGIVGKELMNGHAHGLVDRHVASGEKIFMTEDAYELSRHAAGFAARARQVQLAHLAAIRAGASSPVATASAEPIASPPRPASEARPDPAGLAREHAGFAHKVSAAHEAAMRASAERARQADAVKNRPGPAREAPVERSAPAQSAQDPAAYARKVSAAHEAAMRASAERAQAAGMTNGAGAHSAIETRKTTPTDERSAPVATTHAAAAPPPMASQLSWQAADMARRAIQRESAFLAETRARQADAPASLEYLEGDANSIPPLKGEKSMKKLRKALKKLKKEIKKLNKAGI